MLSGVLRGESPAVDARPALSTSDSILMCHPKSGYLKRLSPSQINTLPFPYLA